MNISGISIENIESNNDNNDNNTICIIDGDSLCYKYWSNDIEEMIEVIDKRVLSILHSTNCVKYIGFLGRGRTFRYDVAKCLPYKANRVGMTKPPLFEKTQLHLIEKWNFIINRFFTIYNPSGI